MRFYLEKVAKNAINWSGFLFVGLLLGVSLKVNAQQDEQAQSNTVAEQLQQLRKEVVALNRDLFVLEEDLLFPSSTQVVVYLSMFVVT
jgi:hypothetical protein